MIQATTISGKIINDARWEVTSLAAFQKGQRITVELPVKDGALVGYLSRIANSECMVDGTSKSNYAAVMSCMVSEVRHMVVIAQSTVDTLVMVQPMNRTVECVLQYILNPSKCDPKFIALIRGNQSIPVASE